MGHYDDSYEYSVTQETKRRNKRVKEAKELIEQALKYTDVASNLEQYKIKLKEALFWLDET